ncbi:hypothetical protein [Acinetobacter pittii]|uniref:hypothetical protein n=1 Tax=Acinetobacter pittii TaxID=48296 RepID=UPI0008388DE9|nr:hypothetical protein [Acinetobacter pittii]OCY57751.1 hypothetical protein BFR82_13730 [Acinetobacter pittii]
MKEFPILFKSNMVNAILEGRKTQTRRVVKNKLVVEQAEFECGNRPNVTRSEPSLQYLVDNNCPYGQVGDRLWVRETWAPVNLYGEIALAYKADSKVIRVEENESFLDEEGFINYDDPRLEKYSFAVWAEDLLDGEEGNWSPSIHMPRWACRLVLEITSVRVEQLNDISAEDCLKEGIVDGCCLRCRFEACRCKDRQPDLIQGFAREWSNENGFFPTEKWVSYGGKAWRDNPWVWVVEFKVIQGGAV